MLFLKGMCLFLLLLWFFLFKEVWRKYLIFEAVASTVPHSALPPCASETLQSVGKARLCVTHIFTDF